MKPLFTIGLSAVLLLVCSESLNLTLMPGELMSFISQWFGVVAFITLVLGLLVWVITSKR